MTTTLLQRLLQWRFTRFALVGGGATLLQYLLLVLLVEALHAPEVAASAAAFSLSALANYWLNYHFTFASQRLHRQALPRFALVALTGLAVNTACFAALLPLLPYLAAQVVATAVTLVGNFALQHLWIYRRES
ncbi:GtrA family protein [Microbulbifer sp. SAOS-129_SWC]|uniref:GtrA family protein n=1 Tax=Microbulbifer sp. SAOS-129_SWC TaxID=3145235 RepID=UPI003216CAED